MTSVVVVGGSGFVGSHVVRALSARDAQVRAVPAPRLATGARGAEELRDAAKAEPALPRVKEELADVDVVINAAGVAQATSGLDDQLVGANSLLPAVLDLARPPGSRLLQVSSAAVQGRRSRLDESRDRQPFSPYSVSKAWGEEVLDASSDVVVFRPTSVQGAERAVTAQLVRLLGSPLASVAGRGDAPTPQVLVENVADAIAFTALGDQVPPVVLQPWEGLTTADLVRRVGGREPRHVPRLLAHTLVSMAHTVGIASPRVRGIARRVEMLWFGQAQAPGWLDEAGWEARSRAWSALAR